MNLYEILQSYGGSGIYPMHMPGHKRNPVFQMENPYCLDVTEIEGMDDLHHPEGAIRRLMDQMKGIYGTKESYLLVNGSTCGILAAVSACVRRGDTVIMSRNCHRSVYHAVYLLDLKPVYLYPEIDPRTGIALGIRPEQVEEALGGNPSAACVVITSPTYEGVVSDIRQIAAAVHERGIPLVVDEAHGAHFAWGHPYWQAIPETAMSQGADLVVESLHKTLPALTQTGVLHLCSGRVEGRAVQRSLDIYETSSPSYILMAGAAQCMDWMEQNAEIAFGAYQDRWNRFCRQAGEWEVLSLWQHDQKEPSKLVIESAGMEGSELAALLRERYRVQMEMECPGYVLAMTSVCDTEEGWSRLSAALSEIDKVLAAGGRGSGARPGVGGRNRPWRREPAAVRMSLYEAADCPSRRVRAAESAGEISAEFAFLYPPGIPFLAPGEEITEGVLEQIRDAKRRHLKLMGLEDGTGEYIRVCGKRS